MAWTYQILLDEHTVDNSGNLTIPVQYFRDGVVVVFPGYGAKRLHSVGVEATLKLQIKTILAQGEARDALLASLQATVTNGVLPDLDPDPKSVEQQAQDDYRALLTAKQHYELMLISPDDYDAAVAAYKATLSK